MNDSEFKKHLNGMTSHESVFWDRMDDEDEIRKMLQEVQNKLDVITKPCFEEPVKTYTIFTTQWFKKG